MTRELPPFVWTVDCDILLFRHARISVTTKSQLPVAPATEVVFAATLMKFNSRNLRLCAQSILCGFGPNKCAASVSLGKT